ncbi:MAG: hypothetical protein WC876_03370 [Candidatus Thermoplasmatota archaeon]
MPFGISWLEMFTGDASMEPVPLDIRGPGFEFGEALPPIPALREIPDGTAFGGELLFPGADEKLFPATALNADAGGVSPKVALDWLIANVTKAGALVKNGGCLKYFQVDLPSAAFPGQETWSYWVDQKFTAILLPENGQGTQWVWHWNKDSKKQENWVIESAKDAYGSTCESIKAGFEVGVSATAHMACIEAMPWYEGYARSAFVFSNSKLGNKIVPEYVSVIDPGDGSTLTAQQSAVGGEWLAMAVKPGDTAKMTHSC